MKIEPVLASVATLFSCTLAFSQVTTSPQSPTVLDTIYVQLPLAKAYDPASTTISMASNKITIAFRSPDLAPLPPNLFSFSWPVGPLPAGTYQVEVQQDQAVIGNTELTVLPRPTAGSTSCPGCVPTYSHTDMWWNPAESGWGASIVQHGSGNIFGVFFIYADNGTATWYVIPGGQWASVTEFQGNLYQTRGPVLDAFDPNSVNVSLVGSAVIDFDTDPTKASVHLTIAGKTVTKSIQRQTF